LGPRRGTEQSFEPRRLPTAGEGRTAHLNKEAIAAYLAIAEHDGAAGDFDGSSRSFAPRITVYESTTDGRWRSLELSLQI
jgi:hypothetical protein